MNEKIYLIDGNKQLREMEAQDYDGEDLLQTMLADHPDLLAGHQINESEPRRWMLVAREMGVPDMEGGANRWSLDHLFLDQDGIPTLVEVKRASDTRIRREVVGQMFDYAANALLHWPLETIRRSFEATCASNQQDPDVVVANLLDLPPEAEEEIESYWTAVENNLNNGRLRLVFLADRIPLELRRIIEFLNEQMHTGEVLGVELRQYAVGDLKAIVPRVVGKTTAAEKAKTTRSKGRQWDEPSFIYELQERCGSEYVSVATAIMDWARAIGLRETWGKGRKLGSFVPVYDHPSGDSHALFALWTDGDLEFYFYYHKSHHPFVSEEKRLQLLSKLNEIPNVTLVHSDIERRPSVPLAVFHEEENLKSLQATYEWYMSEVDRASSDNE